MKNKTIKTGIILAAGLGTRLCESDSGSKAKPLFSVNELTLLLRAIDSHEIACRDRVVIVVGWEAESVENHVRTHYKGSIELIFIYNEYYRLQNGISVLCASPLATDGFILTMADHILDDKIMQLAKHHTPPDNGATLCVDYKLDTIFDMDDATKVYAQGNLVKSIGKEINKFNCVDTGVFIGTTGLMDAIAEVYKKNGDASLSEGVQLLAAKGKMEVLDIKDGFWQDVDTPEMLAHAEKLLQNMKTHE